MVKCVGKTADGRKCHANAMVNSQYCYVHAGGRVGKPRTRILKRSLYAKSRRTRSRSATRRYKKVLRRGMTPKPINKASCRPRTSLGRPSRKLPGDMVIPTLREYLAQFPENERPQRAQEFLMMDGCQLAKVAVHKEYARKSR